MAKLGQPGRIGQQIGIKPSVAEVQYEQEQLQYQQEIERVRIENEKLKQEAAAFDKRLENLEITSSSQIPANLRSYYNIPDSYFQKVREYKAAQEYQAAYNAVLAHYNKGMLWAVAGYGEGLEREIAQKMIKEGYSPALGGLLEQEQYTKRIEAIKEIGGGDYKIGMDIIKEEKLIGEMRASGEAYLKEHPDAFKSTISTKPSATKTDTTFGSTAAYQEKYIRTLTASPTAKLTVGTYTGIQIPYGQKDITWQQPYFGTIVDTAPSGFKTVSLFETLKLKEITNPDVAKPISVLYEQKASKISKEITSELMPTYQGLIDTGELTVEQAQKQFETKAEEQFKIKWGEVSTSKEFQTQIKETTKFRSMFETSFSPEYKEEQKWKRIELATDIGAIAIGSIVPSVTIGYFAGKGFYYAGKGQYKDTWMAEYSPTGELIVPRYPGLIPGEESKKAGTSLLFAGVSAISWPGKIATDITKLRGVELAAKRWTVTSKNIVTKGDKVLLEVRGSKTIGTASAEGRAFFPIEMTEKGAFKITGGLGRVETRIVDFGLQGVVKPGKEIIYSSVKFPIFGRGVVTPTNFMLPTDITSGIPFSQTKLYSTTGEGYISPFATKGERVSDFWSAVMGKKYSQPFIIEQPIKVFKFGGAVREGSFISGEMTKFRLYPTSGKVTGLFKPNVIGEMLEETSTDLVSKGWTSYVGGGAKSSPVFIKSLYEPATTSILKTTTTFSPAIIKGTGTGFAATTFQVAEKILLPSTKPAISLLLPLTFASTKVLSKSKAITIPKLDYKVNVQQLTKQISTFIPATTTETISESISRQLQKPRTQQEQETQQIVSSVSFFTGTSSPIIPKVFEATGFGIDLGIPVGIPSKKTISKQQGYLPQVKTKGKWITLSKQPMNRSAALGRAARVTDNTTAAQFRIKKVKGIPSPATDNYFSSNQRKFRPYRIKKGRAIGLQNQFIEIRKHRADTSGELRGLTAGKMAKSMGWLMPKVKTKTKRKRRKK